MSDGLPFALGGGACLWLGEFVCGCVLISSSNDLLFVMGGCWSNLTHQRTESSGAEGLFVSSYPKLLSLLKDFWRRLAKLTQTDEYIPPQEML